MLEFWDIWPPRTSASWKMWPKNTSSSWWWKPWKPSIHFLYLLQRSSGERRGTPWTGRQSITNDSNYHTHAPRNKLETPVNLVGGSRSTGENPRLHAASTQTEPAGNLLEPSALRRRCWPPHRRAALVSFLYHNFKRKPANLSTAADWACGSKAWYFNSLCYFWLSLNDFCSPSGPCGGSSEDWALRANAPAGLGWSAAAAESAPVVG